MTAQSPLFKHPLTIVDVETTGTHGAADRIIEIGILRVENGIITKQFESLVNPQTYINPFITNMTGISSELLEKAPTFEEIKEDVYELFEDSYFVAHNVRFDYGFIKNEYKRLGITFTAKYFCSARLSQVLFPQHRRHNLDAIMERFNIECEARHRALGDAKVIYDFFTKLTPLFEEKQLEGALGCLFVRPSAPPELAQVIGNLPESPGVYLLYNKDGILIYVGKSTNIRSRVISHFSSDYMAVQEAAITSQTARIEYRQTPGELGALLLESQLIKELQPIHNRVLRAHPQQFIARLDHNKYGYKTAKIEQVSTIRSDDTKSILGIYKSKTQARSTLEDVYREFHLCMKIMNLEKTTGACFQHKIGNCPGACIGAESPGEYNERFDEAFSKSSIKQWPFQTPIIITEEFDGTGESYLFDQWCLKGRAIFDAYNNYEYIPSGSDFDYDIYKILKRFLRDPANKKKIRRIKPAEISMFTRENNEY